MSSISVSSLVLGSLTMEVEGADASLSLSVLATAPAVLSVELGTPGAQGDAATIAVGTTTTLAPGSSATVANAGTSSAAVFNFGIPAGQTGATGATGATGSPGTAATIAAGTTTTGAPGSSASVTNSGTSGAAVFDFTIPRGDVGATGATGATGPAGPGVAAGGSTGQFLSKASGASYDTTWSTIVPGDRYLTTSSTSLTIGNGTKALTVGTGLSYTVTQNVTISFDGSNHMHGEVLAYNAGTGAMSVDVNHHTGSGTYSAWTVNVGGVTPVTSTAWGTITGTLSAQTDLQTALDAKAPLASPALTGTPTAPTATAGTSTTQLATTAFVTTADNLKANLASPTFTGTPAAPTATAGTNTTQLATTAFVTNGLSTKANLASPTFTGTVTIPAGASISGFAPLASPALTGTPTAPTASTATNTTQIATTAYVKAQGYATLASPTFTGTVTIPAGASISGYLTTSSAASTYQTLSGMSSYLTTSAAASTYLTQSNAASTYQTLSGMSSYLTTSAAASTYQPIGSYLTDAPSDGNTYGRLNGAWSVVGGGGVAWGAITGTLSSQTDLQSALDAKLDLAGGTMTGGLTLSATGIIFSDSTTLTTAPAGSALAANQLTNAVVTANPTAGPTTAGDVLQYNGTDLIWAAGGGGGGVAWGAITGTLSSQTDLQTALDGKLAAKTVYEVTSNAYTLASTDANNIVYIPGSASGGFPPIVITVPEDATYSFAVGTVIILSINNSVSGSQVDLTQGGFGVPTLIGTTTWSNTTSGNFQLIKVAANTWICT